MSFDPGALISLIEDCKKLDDNFTDVRESSAKRRRLLDEVHSLQSHLEALQVLAETPGIVGDKGSLGHLLDSEKPFDKAVQKTFRTVDVALGRRTSDPEPNKLKVLWWRVIAALWWTFDKAEVTGLFSDLERYKSRIALALEHGTIDHIITADYCLKVAQFVSEQDFNSHQMTLIEQRLPETGMWLLLRHPKFVAWRDNEDSERTVWCHGFAGVGKSVIAALIVEHLQSAPGNIVLSVFCRYTEKDALTNTFTVLRGLLRQLIEKSVKVPPALDDLYQSQTDPNPKELSHFLNDLAVSHARRIYIVIDALDECPIGVDLLRAVQDLHTSFRILVTSRPVFDHSAIETHKHSAIEVRAADEDILTAVNTTLQKLKHSWLDEELKRKIRATVVEKAGGMFLLASLQLRELERDVTCPADVLKILDSLPDTLNDAYQLTFDRIHGQGKRKNKLICRALALIALRSPFLKIKHVQHLLAEGDTAQYTDIETILQCLHGLVRRRSDSLEFIHYSVHEYITAHWSKCFLEHPNRIDFCLNLGLSTLKSLPPNNLNVVSWEALVSSIGKPEELKQVMSFLSTPAARAPFIEFTAKLPRFWNEPRLMGTGTWMTHHPTFVAWRDNRESPRTLWCYGHPGAGKSVMAAFIVYYLQSMGDIVLSVFFDYTSDIKFTRPSSIICSMLRQLLEDSPKVLHTISTLYESQNHADPDTVPGFLSETAASHARPIYIVVDALDECQIAPQLLRAIQQLGPSFRVLVTSRPVFKEIEEHPSIQIRASDHDILVAVDDTLPRLKHAWLDEELQSTIRAKIVEKADGMFLFASLQLRELERYATSRRDVVAILDSLPFRLYDEYQPTFQRIREQGERKNQLACRALALIALNSDFLNTDDIQDVLADGDGQRPDIETIVQCCYGLVKHPDRLDRLSFIHNSVHHYTTRHWSGLFPEHPNRIDLCLKLGFSTLTRPTRTEKYADMHAWDSIVRSMEEPKELDQVISLLSTPETGAVLVESYADVAPFAHDPLLIACYSGYIHLMEYMIQTAPPDVQCFNEALRAFEIQFRGSDLCASYINTRPDMRVNSDGVAVDLNEGEGN